MVTTLTLAFYMFSLREAHTLHDTLSIMDCQHLGHACCNEPGNAILYIWTRDTTEAAEIIAAGALPADAHPHILHALAWDAPTTRDAPAHVIRSGPPARPWPPPWRLTSASRFGASLAHVA